MERLVDITELTKALHESLDHGGPFEQCEHVTCKAFQ